MALSREDRDKAFAGLVRKTLIAARASGMTDTQIAAVTGVPFSTFHRWGRGDIGPNGPRAAKVREFFTALNGDVDRAFEIMGWQPEAPRSAQQAAPTAEPDLPREVVIILRKLRDPKVKESEKFFLLETLKALAARKYSREDEPSATADE